MDDESVSGVYDVIHHVSKKKAGDTCLIEISREGTKIFIEVTFFESKGHGKK
jgi:PDZ domain-containing secreted protein